MNAKAEANMQDWIDFAVARVEDLDEADRLAEVRRLVDELMSDFESAVGADAQTHPMAGAEQCDSEDPRMFLFYEITEACTY